MNLREETLTLDNGLTVLLVDTKSFPSLTTLLLVGAGSRYEQKDNNGIAHFFEHMAFKGTKKYPSSFEISSRIEGIGAVFNAYTSKDHTGYWIKSTNEHFGLVTDILSGMITESLLAPEEIEREKGVIVEEINMYEDTPKWKVSDLFEELMYKGTSLGYEIAGTKDTVTKFSRKTFTDYMGQLYHPGNAVLVVAGGMNGKSAEYARVVREKFGAWKKGKVTGSYEPVTESQKEPRLLVRYKKTEQAHFCLGFRAYSFLDERRYILSLLSIILGGGMSSRLFIQVRERRGLCYYISASKQGYHDVGNFVTSAGVRTNLEKTKEAVKVTLAEHRKIIDGDITDAELERAKELFRGRLYLSLEDSSHVASFFGTDMILKRKTATPDEIIAKVNEVTKEQIRDVAAEIFRPERLNFSIIGPYREHDFDAADFAF